MRIFDILEMIVSHNTIIIEWLVISIIGLISLWVLTGIFRNKSKEIPGGEVKEIKKSLRKILSSINDIKEDTANDMLFPELKGQNENLESLIQETTNDKDLQVNEKNEESFSQNEVNKQIQILNKMVEKKEAEMKELADGKDEEKKNLKSRIEELKEKLDGYDLIATDLANLSKIKEENEELKKKMETLNLTSKKEISDEKLDPDLKMASPSDEKSEEKELNTPAATTESKNITENKKPKEQPEKFENSPEKSETKKENPKESSLSNQELPPQGEKKEKSEEKKKFPKKEPEEGKNKPLKKESEKETQDPKKKGA